MAWRGNAMSLTKYGWIYVFLCSFMLTWPPTRKQVFNSSTEFSQNDNQSISHITIKARELHHWNFCKLFKILATISVQLKSLSPKIKRPTAGYHENVLELKTQSFGTCIYPCMPDYILSRYFLRIIRSKPRIRFKYCISCKMVVKNGRFLYWLWRFRIHFVAARHLISSSILIHYLFSLQAFISS